MSQEQKDKQALLKEASLNPETRRPRKKRLIVPKNVKIQKSAPLVEIMNDALSIISSELVAYKNKTAKGITLDFKEARAVSSYMDSLIKLSKESRESQRPEQLEELSDEQLLELANQSLAKEQQDDQ